MIQYPTNISPENVAIVPTRKEIAFTFNGDILSSVTYQIRDYDSGEVVHSSMGANNDFTPLGYNGSYIPRDVMGESFLSSGRNYTLQMMLTQHTVDGTTPIYDMPVISGNIISKQQAIGTLASRIFVGKNISSIYPWGGNAVRYPTYSGQFLVAGMIMQYGGEKRLITSYTPAYTETDGLIEIESPFTMQLVPGASFTIYANFILTPQYYFSCRANPSITFTHVCYSNRIVYDGVYSQSENSMIKYYQLELQWSNNQYFIDSDSSTDRMESVAKTGKIYSQGIHYTFWNPYRHDNRDLLVPDYYRVICTVVTQDNAVYTEEPYVFSLTPTDYSDIPGNVLYSYELSWDRELGRVLHTLRGYGSAGVGVAGTYELFREDLRSGEVVQVQPNFNKYLSSSEIQGYDATASTHGNYKYTLRKFDGSGAVIIPVISSTYTGEDLFPSDKIETNECAYYISDLTVNESLSNYHPNETSNSKLRCDIGDTWVFRGEISDTTITNNLDLVTHVGYNQFISTTSTDVNYMSGTLSAMIGYVNCATKEYVDDIALVKAWRKFITQKKMFLLKSQKGDVWVVRITDNPTTQYQENYSRIPTTFAFSWAECYNVDDIFVYDPDI